MQRFDDERDKCRFSRAEIAVQGDDVAGEQCAREVSGDASEIAQALDVKERMSHAMFLRVNDIIVGVITGAVAAVAAAALEAFFVAVRFLSLGVHGGGLGSKMPVIALVGAVIGGLVGYLLGFIIKPREQAR